MRAAISVTPALLLLLVLAAAASFQQDLAVSVAAGAGADGHGGGGGGDCDAKCRNRCSLKKAGRCYGLCVMCCGRCGGCVPSGPYASKDECPCYRDMKSPKTGRPKCP